MKVTDFMINLTSEDREGLMAFYRDVVGLPPKAGMDEFALELGPGATLAFDGHSEVHGRTKEPARVLLDLWVDSVAEAEEELKAKGVTFLRSQGREYWGGIISTFQDPDGNYVQLMEFDPASAREEGLAAATT
ncbi:MAG: VOC family protein [Dehalococcoidia bacterium]